MRVVKTVAALVVAGIATTVFTACGGSEVTPEGCRQAVSDIYDEILDADSTSDIEKLSKKYNSTGGDLRDTVKECKGLSKEEQDGVEQSLEQKQGDVVQHIMDIGLREAFSGMDEE